MTTKKRRNAHNALSLLELVIVCAIITVVAAIAIPRLSRGSRGAADSALSSNLAALRKAIEFFAAEHGGLYPTEGGIVNQLTKYSDVFGDAQATKDATHIYGPYLRKIPPLPVGIRKGFTGIEGDHGTGVGLIYDEATGSIAIAVNGGVGWIYDETTGSIRANTLPNEKDESGRLYSDY